MHGLTSFGVALPVEPPVPPMLAALQREVPHGDFIYEPKWDGFRCLAFREEERVDLRSRHDRPLARYFPEVGRALRELPEARVVLDGELVVVTEQGFDFAALMMRLHPAVSRVERLSAETPAAFVAFDLLAVGNEDLRQLPFAARRERLVRLLRAAPPTLRLTPATGDPALAEGWLHDFVGGGIDGVVAKPCNLPYRPGVRAMTKVKLERTADCVVAGLRLFVDRPEPSSLLLGLYGSAGELHHIGVVTSFRRAQRRGLLDELRDLAVPLAGHPWERGFLMAGAPTGRLAGAAGRWSPQEMALDWVPLAPERVCEVAYDQVDGSRLRHPARFRRWRPDRDPRSCALGQLEVAAPEPAAVLCPP
jgi:ATP-dependent DNA ligase